QQDLLRPHRDRGPSGGPAEARLADAAPQPGPNDLQRREQERRVAGVPYFHPLSWNGQQHGNQPPTGVGEAPAPANKPTRKPSNPAKRLRQAVSNESSTPTADGTGAATVHRPTPDSRSIAGRSDGGSSHRTSGRAEPRRRMDRLAPHGADPAFRGTGRSARHAVDFRAGGGELGPRRDAESRLRLQVPAAPRPPRAAPPDTVAVPPAPLVLPRPSRLLRPSPRPRLPAPPPEAAPAARSIPRRRRGKDVAEAPPPPPPVPAPVRPLRRPPRLRRGYSLRDAPRLDRRAARRARADEGTEGGRRR
ncbi:hypothetical protein THAOC_02400, partial [Thalassiosira oceanica]